MNWNHVIKDLFGDLIPPNRPLLRKLFNHLVDKMFPPGALHDADPVLEQSLKDAQAEKP